MPLYEYLCKDCNTKFEMLRPMSQVDKTAACPECETSAPRVFSVFAAFTSGQDEGFAPIAGAGGGCGCCGPDGCACSSFN